MPDQTERAAFLAMALAMIETICCTPSELRQWWREEIGNAPEAKPGWGKRRVPPGRARTSYSLTPMDCYLIEQACKRRMPHLEALERQDQAAPVPDGVVRLSDYELRKTG
jgi:hypothetical protein